MPTDSMHAYISKKLSSFSLRGKQIPEYMHEGIIKYICDHTEPGRFLSSVICNDLKESVAMADDNNIELLHVYVSFFYNHAPSKCSGSTEAFKSWLTYDNNKAEIFSDS